LGRCLRRRRAAGLVNSPSIAGCQASSDVSSASGPSDDDWRNWVAVHGNDELTLEDVRGIGNSIGVNFRGGQENMFSALIRAGKDKLESSGRLQGTGSRKVMTG
jgi:hypothetical protein